MAIQVDETIKHDLTDEVAEWIEAFDDVIAHDWEQGAIVLSALRTRAREAGVPATGIITTPFCNTIPKYDEVPYPGDRTLERRVEVLIRWNAPDAHLHSVTPICTVSAQLATSNNRH